MMAALFVFDKIIFLTSDHIMPPKKTFIVLENNPEVVNSLAYSLGLSKDLEFHDVYSLEDTSYLPRPVYSLLVTIPMSPAWRTVREAEDTDKAQGCDHGEAILWFKQTIGNACGSIGLLHCALNGSARKHIIPGSTLDAIRTKALPLKMVERAQVLEDSQALEDAHQAAARLGQSEVPDADAGHRSGNHFLAFVKGDDGRLWELEGSRVNPLERGVLKVDEDAISPQALKMGLQKLIDMENKAGGNLRFSCLALAPAFKD